MIAKATAKRTNSNRSQENGLQKIQKKQKQVDPEKFNMQIVEDNLAEVEAMQFILVMTFDKENRRISCA